MHKIFLISLPSPTVLDVIVLVSFFLISEMGSCRDERGQLAIIISVFCWQSDRSHCETSENPFLCHRELLKLILFFAVCLQCEN